MPRAAAATPAPTAASSRPGPVPAAARAQTPPRLRAPPLALTLALQQPQPVIPIHPNSSQFIPINSARSLALQQPQPQDKHVASLTVASLAEELRGMQLRLQQLETQQCHQPRLLHSHAQPSWSVNPYMDWCWGNLPPIRRSSVCLSDINTLRLPPRAAEVAPVTSCCHCLRATAAVSPPISKSAPATPQQRVQSRGALRMPFDRQRHSLWHE
eukprot:SAG31_NODE_836_length_11643_cov_3.389813_10_plen_213_part_00